MARSAVSLPRQGARDFCCLRRAVLRCKRSNRAWRCGTGDQTSTGHRRTCRRCDHPIAAGDRGFNFTVDRTDRRNLRPEAAAGGRLGLLPLQGFLYAALPGPYALVVCNLLNAVSGAIFGVMMMVVAADLTRRTGGFNLVLGALGVAVSVGASLSTLFTGISAAAFGAPAASRKRTGRIGVSLARAGNQCGIGIVSRILAAKLGSVSTCTALSWILASARSPSKGMLVSVAPRS